MRVHAWHTTLTAARAPQQDPAPRARVKSEMADEAAGEEPMQAAEPLPQLPLNILQVIRAAQGQNGLKHGDYGRYR